MCCIDQEVERLLKIPNGYKKKCSRLKKNVGYTSMPVQHFSPTNIIDGDSSSKLHRIIDAKKPFQEDVVNPLIDG